MSELRFQDNGTGLFQFMHRVLVICPRCKRQAFVFGKRKADVPRISCTHCGFNEKRSRTTWKGAIYGVVKRPCPRCGVKLENEVTNSRYVPTMLITCHNCGLELIEPICWRPASWDAAIDPYFGLSLWLKDQVKGQILWAYNREHLHFLEQVIQAKLRENNTGGRTLSTILPKWMLSAKNRDVMLKSIEKLQSF